MEFHPEVTFAALADHPPALTKESWNGQHERRKLLDERGTELPDSLDGEAGLLAPDGVLDAAAGALTADCILRGDATALGGDESSDLGQQGVIWCPDS